jgi:hypothetical protein
VQQTLHRIEFVSNRTLPMLELPPTLNYIGVFLTMDCNLNCTYCINDPEQAGDRRAIFHDSPTLRPDQWERIFGRIPYREDLPITLQGGEPMMYWKGRGIGLAIGRTNHYYDLLTNFALKPGVFARSLFGHTDKFQRGSRLRKPYQAIRVSYHAKEMNRTWKSGIDELVRRCEGLREFGFAVSRDRNKSDVCIYMVGHPENVAPGIDADVMFETKPFLGVHDGKLYGDYLYPHSTDLVERGFHHTTLDCQCRTTELLIDPLGDVWDCHYHLYQAWLGHREYRAVGNMLDPNFSMDKLANFHPCGDYGKCVGCDTKIKNNRFQSLLLEGMPHTSVQIRNVAWPKGLP